MSITEQDLLPSEKIIYDHDRSFNHIDITNTFARQFILSSVEEQQAQLQVFSYEMKHKLLMKLQEYHFIELFRNSY